MTAAEVAALPPGVDPVHVVTGEAWVITVDAWSAGGSDVWPHWGLPLRRGADGLIIVTPLRPVALSDFRAPDRLDPASRCADCDGPVAYTGAHTCRAPVV